MSLTNVRDDSYFPRSSEVPQGHNNFLFNHIIQVLVPSEANTIVMVIL